jgi:hypothetical protein
MDALGAAEAWSSMRASAMREMKTVLPSLWMQAITEAGEDPEIRRHVRGHMREVHDFYADCLRRVQQDGAIPAGSQRRRGGLDLHWRQPAASIADRSAVLAADDLNAIKAERQRCSPAPPNRRSRLWSLSSAEAFAGPKGDSFARRPRTAQP